MPRAPGLRARSKNAVTGVIEAASDLTANLHAADEAKLLEEGENAVLLPCLSAYHQSLRILFGHGGSHPTNEQLTDLTHGFLEADIPNTLLACLKTITPSSLIAPAGCSDPSCSNGQCGPPSSTPIILMVLNETLSVVTEAPNEAKDVLLKTIVDAGLASTLSDLVDVASTAIRAGPRDMMAVVGSDHALAAVLDALQFLRIWITRHGHEQPDDGSPHYCLDLLSQIETLQLLPRAIVLHETLTKVISLFRGTIELRTMGTDAAILQLVGLYVMCGRNYPEVGINALSSPLYPDMIFRAIVRCSLKMGVKVPESALAMEPPPSSSAAITAPSLSLQPHWASYDQCTNILLQAAIGAQTLLRNFSEDFLDDEDDKEESEDAKLAAAFQRSTSIKGLASLQAAQIALSVIKHLVSSRQDPNKPKGDSCVGCALTMLSLQSANLLSQIVLLIPREMAIQGGLAEEVISLLVILQVKAMGRAANLRSSQPVAVEECENGEVDWILTDIMLALHLHLAGGSPSLIDGRLQQTSHISRSMASQHQSLLSHHHLLHDASIYQDANGTWSIFNQSRSALEISLPPSWLTPSSSVRLFRCLEGLLRVPAAPLNSPTSHQPLIRVAHLTALDLAAALLSRSPENIIGRDFVSLCATVKKLTFSIVPSEGVTVPKRRLTPDFTCELIIKVANLAHVTLDALPKIGPLSSHMDFVTTGSFHILCCLHLLISHLTACHYMASASPAQICSEAALLALSVAFKLCVSLLKSPLPPSLVLSSDLQRVASNLLGEIVETCGAVDSSYCPKKKDAGPPSLKRALIWSGALAFLQAQIMVEGDEALGASGSKTEEAEMRLAAAHSIAPLSLATEIGKAAESTVLCAASLAGAAFVEQSICLTLPHELESSLQQAKVRKVTDRQNRPAECNSEGKAYQAAVDEWAMKAASSDVPSSENTQSLTKLLLIARSSYLTWASKVFHDKFAQHPAIHEMPRSRLVNKDPSSPGLTRMEHITSNMGEGGLLKLAQIIQGAAVNVLSSSPEPAWLQLLCEEGASGGLFGSRLIFALRQIAAEEGENVTATTNLQLPLSELMVKLSDGADVEEGEEGASWAVKWAGFYAAQASRGLFVGCCNPRCGNLDKLSEAQLSLKAGEGGKVFCEGCLVA